MGSGWGLTTEGSRRKEHRWGSVELPRTTLNRRIWRLLAFVGDEALYGYEIELRVCKPSEDLMTISSLLGRDIIDQWRVTYDKSALELLAEVISSDAQQVLED